MPGQQTKVFIGTAAILGFCAVTFFGGPKKKSGHGAFDVDRPESVQASMDAAEKNRLSRFSSNTGSNSNQ